MEPSARKLRYKTHATIKKVSEDIEERFNFNTAISAIMELTNMLYAYRDQDEQDLSVLKEAIDSLMILLSPFTPHMCEELWHINGHDDSIYRQAWPRYEEAALVQDEVEVAIQMSGKVRERITVPTGIAQEDLEKLALAQPKIQDFINGKTIIKYIKSKGTAGCLHTFCRPFSSRSLLTI